MNGLELALFAACCTAMVSAEGLSTSYGPPAFAPSPPAQVYAAPAPSYSPPPAVSFAPSPPAQVYAAPTKSYSPPPTVSFAPAPLLLRRAPSVALAPGVRPIPVVPFPGFGRIIGNHVAEKVDTVARALAPAVAIAQEAHNVVRSIANAKAQLTRQLISSVFAPAPAFAPTPEYSAPAPQSVAFSPEAFAAVAPPAGLAPPVSEYGAPAAAPAPAFAQAPAQQYGVPRF